MSTIDLRKETVGRVPVEGISQRVVIEEHFDAALVSGNLVSGNTYNYLTIPENFIMTNANIRVKSADGGAGTSTLTDGTIVPLAAQIMNAEGAFYGTTNLPKYYETGGVLSGVIAAANITTAKFDVIVEGILLSEHG